MFKTNLTDTNYRAKLVALGAPKQHPNAERLQIFTIDFQNIITDLSYKEGDIVVYFPLECTINKELISYFNGFEDKVLNKDQTQKGFFNKHARVRAVRLRQEPSQGFVIKATLLEDWLKLKLNKIIALSLYTDFRDVLNTEFDSWNDIVICQKYVAKASEGVGGGGKQKGSVKGISRLVEGQFRLHNDTENLRKNVNKLQLSDYVGIHYKKHGTSFVVGNVLVNKKLTWFEKILKRFNVDLKDKSYDIIYSSRKVVKNEYETKGKQGFYNEDIWGIVKDEIKDKIPKGFTLYGEILGFLPSGQTIQGKYDYGCKFGEHKTYIYRITFTNEDGFVCELNDLQIKDFCDKYELLYSDTFYHYGSVYNLLYELVANYNIGEDKDWRETLIKTLESMYNEKDCSMCVNKLPEEGIVLRKNNLFTYEAYKLKSFRFLEGESKQLDTEQTNLEDEN